MIRKSLIAFCLLASVGTLALWANSFRPRYSFGQLESALSRLGHPNDRQGHRLRTVLDVREHLQHALEGNAELVELASGTMGSHSIAIALWRRVVPRRDRPSSDDFERKLYFPGGGPPSPGTVCISGNFSYDGSQRGISLAWGLVGLRAHPSGCIDSMVEWELWAPLWAFSLPPLLFAATLWLKPFRRYLRRRRGLCAKCAYDLRGSTSDRCPECGAGIPRPAAGGT